MAAALGKTIAGRIVLIVLAAHVILLPALYFGMVYLFKQSNDDLFLNTVRGHARYIADGLERIGDPDAADQIVEILDSIVLTGDGVYATVGNTEHKFSSELVGPYEVTYYEEDLEIGSHGDGTYFISTPVMIGSKMFDLVIGFDESPYVEQNARVYKNGLVVIGIYLAALLMLLPFVGRRVVQPVRALQDASRQIASGDLTKDLTLHSDLEEIVDLSKDLEHMKRQLVGISEQLEKEIENRNEAETRRRSLEQQLRHSQRLETVGTMAGGIAHEINNILVPIILYTDTAIEDLPKDSPTANDLRRVMASANRAKVIVNQVLTFARKMPDEPYVPVNLADVVEESVELLGAAIVSSAQLDVSIDPDCPPVVGDAALLSQLILNLCTNALQSLTNTEKRVEISLDTFRVDEEFRRRYPSFGTDVAARLVVRDTGHGMDDDTRQRIFEPFFTTREVGEGTGLGLSVVHGIVTDLNGAIEVESALESGSAFYVYLPTSAAQFRAGLQPALN